LASETVDDLLIEAFALCREAGRPHRPAPITTCRWWGHRARV
jgi:hypothetical protein